MSVLYKQWIRNRLHNAESHNAAMLIMPKLWTYNFRFPIRCCFITDNYFTVYHLQLTNILQNIPSVLSRGKF